MPFISAKCPNCNGEIQLDESKESGYCLHCGSKVILQEAVKQKIELSGTVELKSQSKDTLLERADTFLDLGDCDKAFSIYAEAANSFPQDYRCWWGMIASATENFSQLDLDDSHREWYSNIQKLAMPDDERSRIAAVYKRYLSKWSGYISAYDSLLQAQNTLNSVRAAGNSRGLLTLFIIGVLCFTAGLVSLVTEPKILITYITLFAFSGMAIPMVVSWFRRRNNIAHLNQIIAYYKKQLHSIENQ